MPLNLNNQTKMTSRMIENSPIFKKIKEENA
jgi:hypothetical protein